MDASSLPQRGLLIAFAAGVATAVLVLAAKRASQRQCRQDDVSSNISSNSDGRKEKEKAEEVPQTLEQYETAARARLPGYVYHYFAFTAGQTAPARIRAAFDRLLLQPRVLRDVSTISTACELFGAAYQTPVMIAPTGFHRLLHADGELAVAAAAAEAGACYVYNYFYSNTDAAAVAAAGCDMWLQIYVFKEKGLLQQALCDAEQLGFRAIVVTVDHTHNRVRDQTAPRFAAEGDPAVLGQMRFPNVARFWQAQGKTFDPAGSVGDIDVAFTFLALADLCRRTALPVICKGILSVDDARQAVACGAKGLVVSAHGSRQSDAVPAPVAMLQDIAQAVGPAVPVLLDSGVRTGSDVLRGLACGARGVMVGRPVLWGLAARGGAGVGHVLQILTRELAYDMQTVAACSIKDIAAANLVTAAPGGC